MVKHRDKLLEELRGSIEAPQKRMQNVANKHRRLVEFEVGKMVYLKLRSYRQVLMARRSEKLAPCYFCPYEVIQRIGKVPYKLQLSPHSSIHPIFHVSQLKSEYLKDRMYKRFQEL